MQRDVSEGSHSRDTASLRTAFAQEGCPVCTVTLENMHMAMDTWNYEGFTDVEHRQSLTRLRGFCPLHTWQLAQRNNAFQLSVVYQEILDDLLEKMRADGSDQRDEHQMPSSDVFSSMKRLFQTEPPPVEAVAEMYTRCPFCHTRAAIEQRLIERLGEMLSSEEMQQRLRQSTGLCRPHFARVRQYTARHRSSLLPILVSVQRDCLRRSLDEVQELIRKHDYHFSQEAHGEEMTAWRRAAELCAGNPGVW